MCTYERGYEVDFKQAKQKKQRGVSVEELTNQLQEQHFDYVDLVVLGVKENGGLDIGYSTDNNAAAIGYLEIAKEEVLSELMYGED